MARRNDIDWEAVEKDYRAGLLTLREISAKHRISTGQLQVRAKSGSWTRDLSDAIRQKAKEKVSSIDVQQLIEQSAHESAQQSAQTIKNAIDQAADIQTRIILDQRGMIGEHIELAKRGVEKLSAMLDTVAELKDLTAWTNAQKANVETMSKLIDKQRQNYNIDEAEKTGETIEDIITRLNEAN